MNKKIFELGQTIRICFGLYCAEIVGINYKKKQLRLSGNPLTDFSFNQFKWCKDHFCWEDESAYDRCKIRKYKNDKSEGWIFKKEDVVKELKPTFWKMFLNLFK